METLASRRSPTASTTAPASTAPRAGPSTASARPAFPDRDARSPPATARTPTQAAMKTASADAIRDFQVRKVLENLATVKNQTLRWV